MGVHKLTAGDGYTYLTRQVAVHDASDRGHRGLADYYAEKGESPGRWFGAGVEPLALAPGSEVTEAQMRNLFGEGRHPNAEQLEDAALDAGASVAAAKKASQLGRLFAIYRGSQPEFIQETARRYVAYNLAHGESWRAPVPSTARARIRTELGDELFAREHGRVPLDERERGSFMAKSTRQQTTAVAGYDLTFTPVKSVSTLWALADHDVAKQVEDAHHDAVEETLRWLEREVLFTRRGRGGVQQVKARGLVAGIFTHRDARSGDPHLHTHVAVSNKVQDLDGHWLAVDGRVIYKANVTLSETYNTLLEAHLVARLGVRFEARDPGPATASGKRAVREVVGVDHRLTRFWSSRNRAIEARRRALTAAFQAEHGRPPTDGEAVTLGEKAWDQTRQAKHEPRSEADQRVTWMAEAASVLGGRDVVQAMVERCVGHKSALVEVTDQWVAATADLVVARVAQDRATWQVWHLRAEAQRQARTAGIPRAAIEAAVDRVVEAAISDHSVAFPDLDPLLRSSTASALNVTIPGPLRRSDRTPHLREVVSVYSLAGAQQYTSTAVLDAERLVLEAARRTGGRTISEVRVGIAVAEAAANGLQLNAAQQALVRATATSGRLVQLALAPAGTGKTTALRVLTRAWEDSGGTVIGLAPSAVAAHELAGSVGAVGRTDTLAKLVWHIRHGDPPDWMQHIDHTSLVLIDEAGMAATTDLATAIDYITSRGGQIRLIGDDRQLASVAAGGILRDIAHQVGAVTLTEVHRFRNPDGSANHAEAAATLALRDGDPSAVAFYADRGRIHVGDLGTCADQAYTAWAADRTAGLDSVLLAPTREVVAELNTRARNDRLANRTGHEVGVALTLVDGTNVSAGDRVITRRNDRRLTVSHTDWVKNGDRWTVQTVHADGSLTVTHDELRRSVRLPRDYVATSVQLGYATTIHGAQGITTGSCHVVLTGQEDRNLLYVALTRGRHANHLYLATTGDGDPHHLIHPDTLAPPTALDRLTAMLARDGSPVSATTTARDQNDPHRLLGDYAARYHDALTTAAEHLLGNTAITRLDQHAASLSAGWEHDVVTDAPAWPTLRSHLALIALDGHNPFTLLTEAATLGTLDDARDPAAVLDARLDHLTGHLTAQSSDAQLGPLPWLPAIPTQVAEELEWGPFLTTYRYLVEQQIDTVRHAAQGWTAATAPTWAHPFVDGDADDPDTDFAALADLRADLAVWRAATHTPDTDLRPTGERRIGAPGDHQARLNHAVHQTRPTYPYSQRDWYRTLPEAVRTDPWITPLCHRIVRLERAGLPVRDYLTEALGGERPLPDEYQAAALWWRLAHHLGPPTVTADQHTADVLHPDWLPALTALVGTAKADYLRTTPAWPALVAAVDEAAHHHGWTPHDTLNSALTGLPHRDTNTEYLTGIEVADALVLRIATLTDQPPADLDHPEPPPYSHASDTESAPPDDADSFMAAYYRDHPAASTDSTDSFVPDTAANPTPSFDTPTEDPFLPPLPATFDEAAIEHVIEDVIEHVFPDPDQVPAARMLELNGQALAYYQSCYHRSWAPDYLRDRLGADPTELAQFIDGAGFAAGYAPPGPRSLLTHLTTRGATLDELEQTGLIRRRDRHDGTTDHVDVFRDRLVLPIHDPHQPDRAAVLGFVGRRNPTKTDHDYAGPKYLNTKTTPIFTKGEALFGYAEIHHLLANGALPVIVEGPLDAYAITLASHGTAVGLAPMGTALTLNQTRLLLPHAATHGHHHVAVATDPDPAGWKAAQTAYWHLTAADLDPTLIELPDGLDPADLLHAHGADAIIEAIERRVPLADAMTHHALHTASDWADPHVRQDLLHQTARILAARGTETWPDAFESLNSRLHLAPGILEHLTLTESIERDRGRLRYAEARIADLNAQRRRDVPPRPGRAIRILPAASVASPRNGLGSDLPTPPASHKRSNQDRTTGTPDPLGPGR